MLPHVPAQPTQPGPQGKLVTDNHCDYATAFAKLLRLPSVQGVLDHQQLFFGDMAKLRGHCIPEGMNS